MHHRRSTRARALVGVLAACAAVCEGGNAPPAAVAPYVAPSFQEASVVPALLGEYDVPTSVSVGTKIKDKTDVFLSLIKARALPWRPAVLWARCLAVRTRVLLCVAGETDGARAPAALCAEPHRRHQGPDYGRGQGVQPRSHDHLHGRRQGQPRGHRQ